VLELSIIRGRRDFAISAALLLAACALAALLAARSPLGVDYSGAPGGLCDCAAGPISALAHGRVHHFFATQPVMGSFSLLLRAPFALLGLHLTSGTTADLYRFGAFPCLLAAGLLAVYLFGRMRELRRPPLAAALVALLVAVNPLTTRALRYGHPEELLASALCVAALLAAARRRPLLAGVLLGAAFATKQWALLAALPVIIAAGPQRGRVAVAAAASAALLIVPMAAGDLHRFIGANRGAGVVGGSAMPTNIWFMFGRDVPVQLGANGASTPPRTIPAAMAAISHPLILATGFGLALLWWRRRRDAAPEDALLLLALILLVRCLLDPITNSYYHLAFLVSLAAWEGLRTRGLPVLTVISTLLVAVTVAVANNGLAPVDLSRLYLAWALPLAGLLAVLAFRPERAGAGIAEPA
jgi:Glycosyltransferase family 87